MTAAEFRRIALSLPKTSESSHMHHPDFRVAGKIFATLGYPEKGWGMVKLFPDQQAHFVKSDPAAFMTVKGKWGQRGATSVRLKNAKVLSLRKALRAAWVNAAPKRLATNFQQAK